MSFEEALYKFKTALAAELGDFDAITNIGVKRETFYRILQDLDTRVTYTGRDYVKSIVSAESINELKVLGVQIVIREPETF